MIIKEEIFRKDEFFNMIYPLYLGLQAEHFKLWANQNHALKNSVRKNVEIDLIQFETFKRQLPKWSATLNNSSAKSRRNV